MRMFDLTPNVIVSNNWRRLYVVLRVVLYGVFFILACVLFSKIVFPSERGSFDFQIFSSGKNTIADPRTEEGVSLDTGAVSSSHPMLFNIAAAGSFSRVEVSMTVDSITPFDGILEVIRSYRAFLYPTGSRVGFREGSLIRNDNGFFIVSDGLIRKFASGDTMVQMGYHPEQFQTVGDSELDAQGIGSDIIDPKELVTGSIVRIDGVYYQYFDGKLLSFVSERAYHSQYRDEDALTEGIDRFVGQPIGDQMIGFSDGVLISYGESAYAVEGSHLRPIDSPDTFIRKGYRWESILAATGEEFGIYTRGKLFTIKQPHPNGTVYFSLEEGRYFLVDNGEKREILGEHILAQHASATPITVTATQLLPHSCRLSEGWFDSYRCDIALDRLSGNNSGEYQFRLLPSADASIRDIETVFVRDANRKNLSDFVDGTMQKFRARYGIASP